MIKDSYKTTLGGILGGVATILAIIGSTVDDGSAWTTALAPVLTAVSATVVGIFGRDGDR
jgi:hypothetical protein